MSFQPEAWLRGPVPGVPKELQPVAHALMQAIEEVEQATGDLGHQDLWVAPGGAATIGFHLRHMAGALDRLLTYARGEALDDAQRATLRAEATPTDVTPGSLIEELRGVIDRALAQLESTPPDRLDDVRPVGRAQLPSTVRGLLHHAGEHTARHAAQVITTAKVVKARC
jgi:hypothetical protein